MKSRRWIRFVQWATRQMLRHSLLQILHRGPRGILGPIVHPAAVGATRLWASRAEGLLSRRDRVRGRRAGAESPSRPLAVWLFNRRFLLVILLLVRAAVIVVDFPLVTAQSHHERANIPDGCLRWLLLLQLGYIVVMPATTLLAFRRVALLSLLGWRSMRLLLMLIRRAASTTTLWNRKSQRISLQDEYFAGWTIGETVTFR